MISAALNRIEERRENDKPEFDSLYDAFARLYQQRLAVLTNDGENNADSAPRDDAPTQAQHYRAIAEQLRNVERATVMGLLARHQISEGVLRHLQHELDLLDLLAAGV
jgi:hypothetical protein